jgi:DNA-binding NtrC family response regulator
MEKILIVEDDLLVAKDIRKTLEKAGYKVLAVARTTEKALSFIDELNPTLVLVDIFLKGDVTGIELAAALNTKDIPFIYISANSNRQVMEVAKTTNPYGFVVKPFREKDLLVALDIARYRFENNRQISTTVLQTIPQRPASPIGNSCEGIIGKSAAMMQVFNLVNQVSSFETSVLLLGESGTGKEGIANCIVSQSTRSKQPFIKLNCAAIPAELMEAELFGYDKGAFTGAYERKTGKFEQANGGTMLLDEIGEMPLDMQTKLLRVIQEKEVQRLGSNTTVKVDVRIIAATSKNLEKEVADGKFRLDLYYRLLVFPITLPALRERKDDIPLLVHHFIRYHANNTGKTVTNIDDIVMQRLCNYSWPGNVRELQHLIERAVLLTNTDTIADISLPVHEEDKKTNSSLKTLDEIEKAHIISVLQYCKFRIAGKNGAAELLNLSPSSLNTKIKKLGIVISYA